jgi:calcineurin-like phosphoesterase family protein
MKGKIMIWFTADFHLSHKNIIQYCHRPFQDSDEMDEVILGNFNQKVQSGDILYFLGDLTFKGNVAANFFERFKDIEIHFIIGNHDSIRVIELASKYCASVSYLKDITLNSQSITLCHYAMRVWNKSHYNTWQLYGHSHGKLAPVGKQYDVGIDNNDFAPISIEDLAKIMKGKPNNFNYISKESGKPGDIND